MTHTGPSVGMAARSNSRSRPRCEVVRKGGLEPPRVLAHWILNPARLPIPPLSQATASYSTPVSGFRPPGSAGGGLAGHEGVLQVGRGCAAAPRVTCGTPGPPINRTNSGLCRGYRAYACIFKLHFTLFIVFLACTHPNPCWYRLRALRQLSSSLPCFSASGSQPVGGQVRSRASRTGPTGTRPLESLSSGPLRLQSKSPRATSRWKRSALTMARCGPSRTLRWSTSTRRTT